MRFSYAQFWDSWIASEMYQKGRPNFSPDHGWNGLKNDPTSPAILVPTKIDFLTKPVAILNKLGIFTWLELKHVVVFWFIFWSDGVFCLGAGVGFVLVEQLEEGWIAKETMF